MKIPELLPSDIILSRNKRLLSKVIRFFEKVQSGGAFVSHAAMSLGNLTTKPEVVEALWHVTRSPLEKYDGQEIIVYRHMRLGQNQRNEISLRAISISRQAYGLLKLPLFILDSLTQSYFFTQHFSLTSFKVCSSLIGWSYSKTLGREMFGTGWRSVTPDIIDDYCRVHPEEWSVVYKSIQ